MPADRHRRLHPHNQVRKLQPVGIGRHCPGTVRVLPASAWHGNVVWFTEPSGQGSTSIYASQRVMLVNKVGIRWPGVKICPLPFILAHEIIGSAGSNMTELACWYSMVYSGDTQGLKDTLELLLKQVNKNSRNIQPLRYEESYCIPLPTSLSMQRDNNSTSVCAQDIHSHQRYSLCGYGVHGDCPLSQTRARQRFLCQPEPTGLPVKGHGASPC